MIYERPAVCLEIRHGPADSVFHQAGRMTLVLYPPQFLQADTIHLLLVVVVQPELLHEALGQVATATFAEDGALGPEFHSPLETVLWTAVLEFN